MGWVQIRSRGFNPILEDVQVGDIPSTLKYPKIHKVVLKKQKKEKEIKERNKKCLWAMSVVNG